MACNFVAWLLGWSNSRWHANGLSAPIASLGIEKSQRSRLSRALASHRAASDYSAASRLVRQLGDNALDIFSHSPVGKVLFLVVQSIDEGASLVETKMIDRPLR